LETIDPDTFDQIGCGVNFPPFPLRYAVDDTAELREVLRFAGDEKRLLAGHEKRPT
jgi:hypothetical protein